MDRKRFWMIMVLSVMVIFAGLSLQAQPGPMGDDDRPHFDNERPSPQEMMEKRERAGKFGGKRGPDPEMIEMRKKLNAIQAIAEAHKELARVYEEQKKIDEAAAELKKIITLVEENQIEMPENDRAKDKGPMISRKILPVYFEIARLYQINNRIDDAEKILKEGIAKFENEEPHSASKLILMLSDIYKKANKLDKAEELLKKVIEINQKALK